MRYFIELSYNGSGYHGWQKQPNAKSVQEVLENAMSTLLNEDISLVGCGRTDTGVHAEQFFAHFDIDKTFNKINLIHRINLFLPKDIAIVAIFEVDGRSHARFNAISRTYEYRILRHKNPFYIDRALQIPSQKIDVSLMNIAAKELLNHVDFKCFSRSRTDVKSFDCKVTSAFWFEQGEFLIFKISANRFLRNMVRAIVGTLLEIGSGKRPLEDMKGIIESRTRTQAGASAKAHGLFLTNIEYPVELMQKKN